MDQIYARGDRLMIWFLASHFALGLLLALYHQTWAATLLVGGGALGSFVVVAKRFPRTFFTRAYAGVAQQAFVALHIYQLYGQSEQHFWYFTAFTMMIVYQDALCMWPGALLIILQHSIFAALHNSGMPVHFFPEAYVGFTKLFYHFGIALVQVALCGYWAHLLRKQSLGDAWRKWQLSEDQRLLEAQVERLRESEAALNATSEALAESSRRQRAILDNSPDAMWIRDLDGRHIAVNSAFARFAGRPMHEIEGQTVDALVGGRTPDESRQHDADVIASRSPITRERVVSIAGVERIMEITVSPVMDEKGVVSAISGSARDVTDQRRLAAERLEAETRMQHAQKLESLGLLAGGIAHDFNNLLAGILGNAELARADLPEGAESLESLEQIEQSAQRAADLTRQMLAYAGKGKFIVARCDMSDVVREMADLLRTVVSKKATLTLDLADELPLVEADVTQLRQVVMNLITNASDALGDDAGSVLLRTRGVELGADEFTPAFGQEALPAGKYVAVEVCDTGGGMSDETLARIFDPFFTTKFVGRGLGLAAVLGVLRSHHGAIEVATEEGKGSLFRVYLPSVDQVVSANTPNESGATRSSPLPEGGLALVVDDETGVRAVAVRLLKRAGFRVIAAEDGVVAVEAVRRHAHELTVVLLDNLMPRMNGQEAFAEIRRIAPTLPVLFTSGFSDGVLAGDAVRAERVGFIQKPYSADTLVAAITQLTQASNV